MDLDYGKCAQPLVRREIFSARSFFPMSSTPLTRDWKRLSVDDPSSICWYTDERRLIGPTTWTMPLDINGIEASTIPSSVIDAATFSVEVRSDLLNQRECKVPQGQRIELVTEKILSPCLKYEYCSSRHDSLEDQPERRTLARFLCEEARKAWMTHFDKNISASNSIRIASRLQSFINRTESELIHEAPRLSPEWFKDEQVALWLQKYSAETEPENPRWPHSELEKIYIRGIVPQRETP